MASRAHRNAALTTIPTDTATMRQLTAAELEYLTAAIAERNEAMEEAERTRVRAVEADGAVKSFFRHVCRTHGIDPEVEGVDLTTGNIRPITAPAAPAEDGPVGEPVTSSRVATDA